MDDTFRRRLESTLVTVQRWDADPNLLRHCRQRIFAKKSTFCPNGSIDTRSFLQHFVKYFKEHIMVWCNKPSCTSCGQNGDNMEGVGSRGPLTLQEKHGEASRVEVYRCTTCHNVETTFPRYNNVQILYEISSNGDAKTPGRCGEYANLFGFYCRALGLETRYILDWTDHVWVEVYIRLSNDEAEQWCMIDSCEGVLNEYSMYERGWGKELSYNVAVSTTAVTDVTCRYTRKFRDASLQQRRRAITTTEDSSRRMIQQMNSSLQSTLSSKESQQIQQRWQREDQQLQQVSLLSSWALDQQYQLGRLSGSNQWKAFRNETGNAVVSSPDLDKYSFAGQLPEWRFVGTPFSTAFDNNCGYDFEIYLRPPPVHQSDYEYCHELIQVNHISCAIGAKNALSVVVLDENFHTSTTGGYILQSHCFTTVQEFICFVSSVPSQRILVVVGSLPPPLVEDWVTPPELDILRHELGDHFCADHILKGILHIGQVLVREQPSWSQCISFDAAPKGVRFSLVRNEMNANGDNRVGAPAYSIESNLCTFRNVRPRKISGRVPDSTMSLSAQLDAGYDEKRAAFLSYMAANPNVPCIGYATKTRSPIYILGKTSYPLIETIGNCDARCSQESWNTFLWLPSVLVPDEDTGITDGPINTMSETSSSLPLYDIPIDQSFFRNELGEQLLFEGKSLLPTIDALHNARLVALYFSAHWCGPCRSFTPILAELYTILKEAYPSHGLEVIFVSSDRDEESFAQYFHTMPWLAIPFNDSLSAFKRKLSAKYDVRGIPSLVVLDSISGQIVIPNAESRSLVMKTVQCGTDMAVLNMFASKWLKRIPSESNEICTMLSMSYPANNSLTLDREFVMTSPKVSSFLLRTAYREKQHRIKMLETQLIEEAEMDLDQAKEAAITIEGLSTVESKETLPSSGLNDCFVSKISDFLTECDLMMSPLKICEQIMNESGIESLQSVLTTLWKYFIKCYRTPWISRFRQFQLSFKVADKITMVSGGLELLESLGFQVLFAETDFVASVPIGDDLDEMNDSIRMLCQRFNGVAPTS